MFLIDWCGRINRPDGSSIQSTIEYDARSLRAPLRLESADLRVGDKVFFRFFLKTNFFFLILIFNFNFFRKKVEFNILRDKRTRKESATALVVVELNDAENREQV